MFIEDIGPDYADENLQGALFMYNGKVHRVMQVDSSQIQALRIDSDVAVYIPASEITGWRTFKYPRLGYRRLGDNVVALLSRSPRSYTRGLCYENLLVNLSHSSKQHYIENERYGDSDDVDYYYKDNNWARICVAAMDPVYDGKEEYALFANKERNTFVPNYNFMMDRVGDTANIFLAGHQIGFINRAGKIVTAPKNLGYINNIVRTYAAG